MPVRRAAAIALTLVGLAAPAFAQDPDAGRKMADTWCANCHVVGSAPQAKGTDAVPTFAAIAAMTSTTEMSLAAFLSTPHARMPNFTLSRQEIADVSAYILGLKPKP